MRTLSWIFVAVVTLVAGFSACGQCAAVCGPSINIALVDEAGQPVQPTVGRVTLSDGRVTEFSCRRGGELLDGGVPLPGLSCPGSTLVVTDFTQSVELTISDDRGRRFSGPVPFTLAPTGREICGSQCMSATTRVVLR